LVRTAPPVESRPQVDQNEANKFRTWQQHRPAPPPRQTAPPRQSAPARAPEKRPSQNPPEDHKKN
jgi:hypothetical protein